MSRHSEFDLLFGGLFLGGSLVIKGIRDYRNRQAVEDLAKSKISSAAQGVVEIEGFAFPTDPSRQIECLAKKPCVHYELAIQRKQKGGEDGWSTISYFRSGYPFYIYDVSGAATVEPEGVELEIEPITHAWSSLSEEKRAYALAIAAKSSMLEELPSIEPGFFLNYRCVEKKILLGSPVLFHGEFKTSPGDDFSVQNEKLKTYHFRLKSILGNFKRYLSLFDQNRDGVLGDEESRMGFHRAALSAKTPENVAKYSLKHFGRLKKHAEYPSFLADCHQQHVIQRLRGWDLLKIVCGVIICVAAIYLFMQTRGRRW